MKARTSPGFAQRATPRLSSSLGGPLRHETVLAQDGLAALLDGARLEGNLALCFALVADRRKHLAACDALLLAVCTAILAPLRGRKVLRRVELLFAFREGEGVPAIAACELLISHRKK